MFVCLFLEKEPGGGWWSDRVTRDLSGTAAQMGVRNSITESSTDLRVQTLPADRCVPFSDSPGQMGIQVGKPCRRMIFLPVTPALQTPGDGTRGEGAGLAIGGAQDWGEEEKAIGRASRAESNLCVFPRLM